MKYLSSWFSVVLSVKVLIFKPSQCRARILPLFPWFSTVFQCEGLLFPPFTSNWVNHFGKRSTLSGNSKPETEIFRYNGQPKSGKVIHSLVWMLCFSNLHIPNYWESGGNKLRVKGWMLFSGKKFRIYTRAKEAFPSWCFGFSAGMFPSPAQPDMAEGFLRKSRTCSHNSWTCSHNSRTCSYNSASWQNNSLIWKNMIISSLIPPNCSLLV